MDICMYFINKIHYECMNIFVCHLFCEVVQDKNEKSRNQKSGSFQHLHKEGQTHVSLLEIYIHMYMR